MKKDIEIAQSAEIKPILKIAQKVDLTEENLEYYGKYKAKIESTTLEKKKKLGKLVLVTAINPTPSGEGKSTVSIGLADALNRLGKKTILALREPSMGPVMGMKGGATGGGFSQVLPMEDINLHFTGDMHAITACNNALSAFIDNHIHQGNELNIDPRRILWKRVVDINDRALRQIVVGLGGPLKGVPREDGFDITVASEIMAVLCLATDLEDLKNRLKEIVIGYTYEKAPIRVQDLGVQGALTVLLKDAIKPNLVQTIEGTPTLIHGGPFANIAHGCNSVIATKTALKLGDYCVTEAGFGADLGAEKFLDIKVPILKKAPDVIVIVATIRALKMNGGVNKKDLKQENKKAVQNGFVNLKRHIKNMKSYGVPVVVSINQFETDTRQEIEVVEALCQKEGVTACPTTVWENGGQGGIALAQAVEKACSESNGPSYQRLYQNETSIEEKIRTIATNLYGAKDVSFSNKARKQLVELKKNGWQELPICMAKTQYSFSDDPTLLGAPVDFTLTIRELIPKLGAGFIVCLTGDVMTMPGLPKKPAALNMDIDSEGKISGLF